MKQPDPQIQWLDEEEKHRSSTTETSTTAFPHYSLDLGVSGRSAGVHGCVNHVANEGRGSWEAPVHEDEADRQSDCDEVDWEKVYSTQVAAFLERKQCDVRWSVELLYTRETSRARSISGLAN
eukprot:6455278-Amphidinium_carterae.1